MLYSEADLLDEKKELSILTQWQREPPTDSKLRDIARINPLLVARYLNKLRRPPLEFKEEIKHLYIAFVKSKKPNRAFLASQALYELRYYEELFSVFAEIPVVSEKTHGLLLARLFNQTASSFVFNLLKQLFSRYRKNPDATSDVLWRWAVEALPNDLILREENKEDVLAIFDFFLAQPQYSDTLHWFDEKFETLHSQFVIKIEQSENTKFCSRFYNHYLARCDVQEVMPLLQNMRQKKLHIDIFAVNKIVHKIIGFEARNALLQQMRDENIALDTVTYSILLTKAPDFAQAKAIVQQMRDENIALDTVTYSTLLTKAPDFAQANAIVQQMRDENIALNTVTYNTLLDKAKKSKEPLNVFLGLLEEMIQLGLKPNFPPNKPPYTTFAVEDKIRRSLKPFATWKKNQQAVLNQKPPHFKKAWQDFFNSFFYPQN
ncbi:hypothetical protein [Thioflexithrix psekupsensis]|uniref:Pentacotripeptide-repeat region of PRORP domain-containing protein n=1 Tax=Thioflexithrix psekupsensis TaxID=1570016 RepID=A0A251XBK2_9GAMM|nr:hypothetical protein [Thioflexithrix psekupsensis]OUD16030.1 hypothetical protein TPSD3_01100 [Thioflexithrix psekupsensis]